MPRQLSEESISKQSGVSLVGRSLGPVNIRIQRLLGRKRLERRNVLQDRDQPGSRKLTMEQVPTAE